jgi:hypothetical protein
VSNLTEEVLDTELDERYWFLYPIEGGKESHKISDVIVE